MRIYLAGGVSGNLKPAWIMTAQTNVDFIEALRREGFWHGGSAGIGYKTWLRP